MLDGIQSMSFVKADEKRILIYLYTDSAKTNGFRIDFNGNSNYIAFAILASGTANEIFRK